MIAPPTITYDLIRALLARFARTFTSSAPPVVVHSRREGVRVLLSQRFEQRRLSRVFKAATGESLCAVQRRKHRAPERARPRRRFPRCPRGRA
jgi:hypothetical protein